MFKKGVCLAITFLMMCIMLTGNGYQVAVPFTLRKFSKFASVERRLRSEQVHLVIECSGIAHKFLVEEELPPTQGQCLASFASMIFLLSFTEPSLTRCKRTLITNIVHLTGQGQV